MICPDCERDNPDGTIRCPCGGLVGHVARKPERPVEDVPYRGRADRISYRQFLAKPFPEPSRQWARDLLKRAEKGEHLLRCQIEFAAAAVRTEYAAPVRQREYIPGEDRDDDEAFA